MLIKRYDREFEGGLFIMNESDEGCYVKYDDVKHLIERDKAKKAEYKQGGAYEKIKFMYYCCPECGYNSDEDSYFDGDCSRYFCPMCGQRVELDQC